MPDDPDLAEFRRLLAASGLSQAALARALGVSAMTVNRWQVDRADRIPLPRYATVFLRAFVELTPAERADVISRG